MFCAIAVRQHQSLHRSPGKAMILGISLGRLIQLLRQQNRHGTRGFRARVACEILAVATESRHDVMCLEVPFTSNTLRDQGAGTHVTGGSQNLFAIGQQQLDLAREMPEFPDRSRGCQTRRCWEASRLLEFPGM